MNKISLEIDQVLRHLDDADAVADLAAKEFLMSQYPRLLRPLARRVARMVSYAAQVVTLQQRQYNRHMFEAVRLLARASYPSLPGSANQLIGAEAIETRTRRELRQFLASDEILELPEAVNAEISVLLILHNRAELTLNCLRSLLQSTFQPLEIVIVDNASTDETGQLLQRIRGGRIFRNSHNAHFIMAANQAAKESSGKCILFLNNDTQLDPCAIESAMGALRERPNAGAIGARLLQPNGRLQEADSIVWKTGSACGLGRGEAPDSYALAFRRLADYVSGAFLLTPRSLFEELGGFDVRFAPAYCEDADYCLRLWQMGREVIYEPDALVLHLESSSAQSRKAAVELMRVNQEKLRQKHHEWLEKNHLENKAEKSRALHLHDTAGRKYCSWKTAFRTPNSGPGFRAASGSSNSWRRMAILSPATQSGFRTKAHWRLDRHWVAKSRLFPGWDWPGWKGFCKGAREPTMRSGSAGLTISNASPPSGERMLNGFTASGLSTTLKPSIV